MKIVIKIFVLSALTILDLPVTFGHTKNARKSYFVYTVSDGLVR